MRDKGLDIFLMVLFGVGGISGIGAGMGMTNASARKNSGNLHWVNRTYVGANSGNTPFWLSFLRYSTTSVPKAIGTFRTPTGSSVMWGIDKVSFSA